MIAIGLTCSSLIIGWSIWDCVNRICDSWEKINLTEANTQEHKETP